MGDTVEADRSGGEETLGVPRLWLLGVAVVGESALAAAGYGIAWLSGGRARICWALSVASVAHGAATALAFTALLFLTLRKSPDAWPFDRFKRLSRDVLRPLFAHARPVDLAIISLAAGFGEEVLFRGALQPVVGLVPASLAFGLCHLAGRDTTPLAMWAAFAGIVLGVLKDATGGLAAPVAAHAAYDMLVLALIRSPRLFRPARPGEERLNP
ncbi:MAG: lysostaphin resistance A-like protein [Vicinamibacterales bacterium]